MEPIKLNAHKSFTFIWEGINRHGEHTKGELSANDIQHAKTDLIRQGIVPKRVRKKSQLFSFRWKQRSIKSRDIAHFSRQMTTMLNAGIPLVQSLDIISRSYDKPLFKQTLNIIRQHIESGSTLAEALRKHPKYFNELYVNLIHTGEESGSLDTMFDKVASYCEKTEILRNKIKKALFYPCSVLTIALAVTISLLIFVVPQFESIFSSFGAQLPMLTRTVVQISKILQQTWWIMGLAILGAIIIFKKLWKNHPKFRNAMDKWVLKIPIFGSIVRKAVVARFARTLAITFAAGIALVDALKYVGQASGNAVYKGLILNLREQVATGNTLHNTFKTMQIFPHMVTQMIGIGEESGNLELMLNKVADHYEDEVDRIVDNLSSLIEPIMMVVLGVLIGGLVLAMYLPIFQMGQII